MLTEDINRLTTPELLDLLAKNTREFMALLNQKGIERSTVQEKRLEVQLIQSVIANRRVTGIDIRS